MGKIVILVLVLLCFVLFSGFVNAVSISACQALSSGTTYDVTANITAAVNSSCFTGAANNAVVDCHGFTIFGNYSSANFNKWAFFITGTNLKVSNCVFDTWNLTGWGPGFHTAANSIWENITITPDGGLLRFHNNALNNTINNVTVQRGPKNSSGIFTYGTNQDLTINNGVISGNLTLTSGTAALHNLEVDGNVIINVNTTSENTTFHDVIHEISFFGNTTNLTNVTFYNNSFRVYFGTDAYIYMNGVKRTNNTGNTFSVGADAPNVFDIRNSVFEDEFRIYVYRSIGTGLVHNAVFYNNTINRTNSSTELVNFNDSFIDGNRFYSANLLMERTNFTNISNNFGDNATIYPGLTGSGAGSSLNIYNNYLQNRPAHTLQVENVFYSNIWNNTGYNNDYCIDVEVSAHTSLWNNTCKATSSAVQSHGILLNSNNNNITVYSNYVENASFGYLFEYGTHNSIMYDNEMTGGGIFYSLHDTHDNVAYNNTIEGDLILHDNVTNEYFYNNTVTGNLIFRWDLTLGPEGTGAFNNIIQDTSFDGNLSILHNSTNNTLINVTWLGTETVDAENVSSYVRKWYLDADANINATNISLSNDTTLLYSALSPDFLRQTLTSYTRLGNVQTNQTYTLYAEASGYVAESNTLNILNFISNLDILFVLRVPAVVIASGGGGGGSSFAESTSIGYSKQLYLNRQINIKLAGKSHKLKLISFDNANKQATIMFSSDEQIKTLSLGEEWKINLNSDSYYDAVIKLESTNSLGASVFIKDIHESIYSDKPAEVLPDKVVEGPAVVSKEDRIQNIEPVSNNLPKHSFLDAIIGFFKAVYRIIFFWQI